MKGGGGIQKGGASLMVKIYKLLVKMMCLQRMLVLSGVLQLLIVVHSQVNPLHFVYQVFF